MNLFRVFHFCWTPAAVPLSPSKWVHTHWSGERATLTLVHLNKEDEGLYTLRVNTKSGFDSYSAYVFVRGESQRGVQRLAEFHGCEQVLFVVIFIRKNAAGMRMQTCVKIQLLLCL